MKNGYAVFNKAIRFLFAPRIK